MISSRQKERIKIYRVKTAKKTVIPPYSSKVVSAQFNQKPDRDVVVQPTNFMKGLLVPNMVCEGNKTAPVMVKNPKEDFITLKKGYPIGLGIEVLTVANDDQIEPECNFKLNKIDIEKHSSELAEVEKQLPPI